MIAAALLLIAAPQCADPSFCPSAKDIERAIEARLEAAYQNMLRTTEPSEQGEVILLVKPKRGPQNISFVDCGEPSGGPDNSVICRVTLNYDGPDTLNRFWVEARFTRTGDKWAIIDGLKVWR